MIELDTIDTSGYIRSQLKDYIYMDPKEEEATISIMLEPKYGKRIQDAARNKLLQSHMRLIYGVAYMYARRYNKIVGDLFQAAYIGMFNATLKYDPRRGVKFTSFAIWWITQKIQEEIYVENCKVHCPMYTKAEAARHKEAAQFDLEDNKGRKYLHAMPKVLSTDLPMHDSRSSAMEADSITLRDSIKAEYDEIDRVYTDEEDRKLGILLKGVLDSREYEFVKDTYFYGMTQNQIGEKYGISGERVRQRRNRAVNIAKAALKKLVRDNKFKYTNTPSECNINTIFGV
jgi:RNA polymerase sigma factor (sigma-70 family)